MFQLHNAKLGQHDQEKLAMADAELNNLISVDLTLQEAKGILQARAVTKSNLFGLDPIMDHRLSQFETNLSGKLMKREHQRIRNIRKAEESKEKLLVASKTPKIPVKVKKAKEDKTEGEADPAQDSGDISKSAGADEI